MDDNLYARAEKIVENKIKFYRNFKVYIVVNTILVIINWLCTPQFWWVAFPLFFWGIGVLKDFLIAFVFVDHFDSESYRQRKIQEEMEKLGNKE